jgi:chromosome partitioning protein
VVAVANQKGGVGKTTVTLGIADAAARRGLRVLVVDLDPQANATSGLGVEAPAKTVDDALAEDRDGALAAVVTTSAWSNGPDVAPSSPALAAREPQLATDPIGAQDRLRHALAGVTDDYDLVLLDCPPSLGLLTVNGLVAATGVIIPVQTQYYAMKGLTNLVKVINAIRLKLNRDLRILGLLPTFYDGRTNLARDMLDELRVVGDHHVFSSIVRNTVKLGEAPLVGRPITSYAGSSEAARTYRELAREVVDLGTA